MVNKVVSILINIFILIALLAVSSIVLTKKRVVIVKNTPTFISTNSIKPFSKKLFSNTISIPSDPKERINAIFLGIPGEKNNAPDLTDTLMIMSMDSESGKGFLLSIPRDLLVKIPQTDFYTKINGLYQRDGMESVESVLTKITGLEFDYYAIISLEGVEKIIDQLGGIDINIEKEIYNPAFPSSNNSYQLFTLEKGQQHLDGETALKYIRTRYDPTGDFARMRRQQKVLIAIKKEVSSLSPIWNSKILLEILNTVSDHFQTNLSIKNIKDFWKTSKNIDLEKIKFKVLDPGTKLVAPGHAILGNQEAYVLKPTAGIDNYEEIQNYIKELIAN